MTSLPSLVLARSMFESPRGLLSEAGLGDRGGYLAGRAPVGHCGGYWMWGAVTVVTSSRARAWAAVAAIGSVRPRLVAVATGGGSGLWSRHVDGVPSSPGRFV